jgi:uncharacterized DUF497 family protein
MTPLRFEWDEAKSWENERKHGVSFAEAQSVFFDDNAVEFYDDKHSEREDRFLLLGLSTKMRVLLVCHCLREEESIIRIISGAQGNQE